MRNGSESRVAGWVARRTANIELSEVIMGLHWDPHARKQPGRPVDLDALCVLFDSGNQVLDVIHPGNPSNVGASVIHTGDSLTGSNVWDDEQVFVFANALPDAVTKVAFVVISVTGEPFKHIPGASCHISDRLSDAELMFVDLMACSDQDAFVVATLIRAEPGWQLAPRVTNKDNQLMQELRTVIGWKKQQE